MKSFRPLVFGMTSQIYEEPTERIELNFLGKIYAYLNPRRSTPHSANRPECFLFYADLV